MISAITSHIVIVRRSLISTIHKITRKKWCIFYNFWYRTYYTYTKGSNNRTKVTRRGQNSQHKTEKILFSFFLSTVFVNADCEWYSQFSKKDTTNVHLIRLRSMIKAQFKITVFVCTRLQGLRFRSRCALSDSDVKMNWIPNLNDDR